MRAVFKIAVSSTVAIFAASVFVACASEPGGYQSRYPSSVDNRSVEPRFCAVISGYSTKLSKASRGISMDECQHLISSNVSVCEKFSFCDVAGVSKADVAQNRARVNLLVSSLNQGFAGVNRRIHNLSNLKFRAALKNPSEHIGFQDLEQAVATDTQLQAMR